MRLPATLACILDWDRYGRFRKWKFIGRAGPSRYCETSRPIRCWKCESRSRRDDLQFLLQVLFFFAVGFLPRLIFRKRLSSQFRLVGRLISSRELIAETAIVIDGQRGNEVWNGFGGF